MPFHFRPIRPLQYCITGELTAVVTDNHLRLAKSLDDPVQLTGNPQAGKGRIGDEAQAFSCAIIDDRKHPEPAAIGELIRHEVQRSLAAVGINIGARVPIARLRPPRLRTVSFSPR